MLNLISTLFSRQTKTTEIGGFHLNMAPASQTPDYESNVRGRRRYPSKISTAAYIFDVLFGSEAKSSGPRLAVYSTTKIGTGNTVYIVFDGVGYLYHVNTDMISMTCEPAHHSTKAVPVVIGQLVFGIDELKRRFTDYCKAIEKGADAETLEPNLYAFCDCFYYGFVTDHRELNEGAVNEEEIKRLFDSGILKKENLGISDSLFTKSKFDKASKKPAKPKKAASSVKADDFAERALKGAFDIGCDLTDDEKSLVTTRDFLKTFVITEDFKETVVSVKKNADRVAAKIKNGADMTDTDAFASNMYNGCYYGKPGTGKTTIMQALSAATGLPYVPVTFSKHTEEDVFEGKTKIVDGHPEFIETDIPKYWDRPCILDLEELNSSDPGVLIYLNMMLERPFYLDVNGVSRSRKYRSPLTYVFACMNTGIEGTNPLPPALVNRFSHMWRVMDPDADTFKDILKKKSGQADNVVEWVYEAYSKVINWLKSPEIGEDELVNQLSMRSCFGAIDNMVDGQSPKRAVKNSIVNAVAIADLELGDQIEREVLDNLRDADFDIAE